MTEYEKNLNPNATAIRVFMKKKGWTRNGRPNAMALFRQLRSTPGVNIRGIQQLVKGEGRHSIEVFHAIVDVLADVGASLKAITKPDEACAPTESPGASEESAMLGPRPESNTKSTNVKYSIVINMPKAKWNEKRELFEKLANEISPEQPGRFTIEMEECLDCQNHS